MKFVKKIATIVFSTAILSLICIANTCAMDNNSSSDDRIFSKCVVNIAPLGEFGSYRYTVIFAQYEGKWLYSRHKARATWETPGGHVESGETALDCAKRELYEETGATEYQMLPMFDYSVTTEKGCSRGQVFCAYITKLGEIPSESEMAEIKLFDAIPTSMTYPKILPVLYAEVQKRTKT